MIRTTRKLLADAFYGNVYFPHPEYNFARLLVGISYVIWGGTLLLPGEQLGKWDFWLLWAFFDERLVGVCFSIVGLIMIWRVLELKKPTIYCEWFQAIVASQWWALVLLPLIGGQSFSSSFGELLTALVATYVYVFTRVHQ